ncbi:hypothetical protein LSH36_241g03025 [Paralvinella palmiformis]|uniref:Uncharacterized protein n=1 Tax=Paralvinella palmiformis TaxID=53620 RepID=A0AAD9JLG6_9ANNE|nr:hypothetical protein LSH36_241g03025 [Paralvinella palmiformis]
MNIADFVLWLTIVCLLIYGLNGNLMRDIRGVVSKSGRVTTFGSNVRHDTDVHLKSRSVYLAPAMHTTGILYKVEPYFQTTDPVYIQIWDLKGGYPEQYELIYQAKASSDKANTIKTIYLSLGGHKSYCPLVTTNMALGIWSPSSPLPIAVYPDNSSTEGLRAAHYASSSPPQVYENLAFQRSNTPYHLAIKGYLFYTDNSYSRMSGFKTILCPADLMNAPDESSTNPDLPPMDKDIPTPGDLDPKDGASSNVIVAVVISLICALKNSDRTLDGIWGKSYSPHSESQKQEKQPTNTETREWSSPSGSGQRGKDLETIPLNPHTRGRRSESNPSHQPDETNVDYPGRRNNDKCPRLKASDSRDAERGCWERRSIREEQA